MSEIYFEADAAKGRNTLLLSINQEHLIGPALVQKLYSQGFELKPEFHITIFDDKPGSQLFAQIHNLDSVYQDAIFDFVRSATEAAPWPIAPRDEFYVIRKQYEGEACPRESVIQMVDCPNMIKFYDTLSTLVGDELELPPAHITLATKGSSRGIGISMAADILKFGQKW